MECACVAVDIDNYPEFFEEKTRKAVKPNKCSECRRVIEPGERYEHVAGKWDGHFETFKMCSDCLSIRKSFFCEGFSFGGMLEELGEHINYMNGEVSGDCIKPLTPRAREIVCEMIEREWERFDDDE